MADIASLPTWLSTALLGAVLASFGYLGKQLFDWAGSIRSLHRSRQARLAELLSLLRVSAVVFRAQAALRSRLHEMLLARRPELAEVRLGDEALFSREHPSLTPEEIEIHGLLRSYSVNGLKPLNDAILAWLRADTEFKVGRSIHHHRRLLARQLAALESHLLLWLAQYAVWIPDTPAHALVYLVEEAQSGVPFPNGIDKTIERILHVPKAYDVRGAKSY